MGVSNLGGVGSESALSTKLPFSGAFDVVALRLSVLNFIISTDDGANPSSTNGLVSLDLNSVLGGLWSVNCEMRNYSALHSHKRNSSFVYLSSSVYFTKSYTRAMRSVLSKSDCIILLSANFIRIVVCTVC